MWLKVLFVLCFQLMVVRRLVTASTLGLSTVPTMTNGTFLYFAYGSNLLSKRIHIQNPSAVRRGVARLKVIGSFWECNESDQIHLRYRTTAWTFPSGPNDGTDPLSQLCLTKDVWFGEPCGRLGMNTSPVWTHKREYMSDNTDQLKWPLKLQREKRKLVESTCYSTTRDH